MHWSRAARLGVITKGWLLMLVRPTSVLFASVLGMAVGTAAVHAARPGDYTLLGAIALPSGMWDVAPDGRVMGLSGNNVVHQTSLGSGVYATIGSIPAGTVSAFGASYFAISPSGTWISMGDNGFTPTSRVHVVATGALNTSAPTPTISTQAMNFDGAWASDSELYVSGGVFGGANTVSRVTLSGSTLSAASVVSNIPDASGGVAVHDGAMLTGVGFGARAGEIRSFAIATLTGSGSAVSFDSGSLLGSILSASSLEFDDSDNLIVAGQGGVTLTNLIGESVTLVPLGSGAFYTARYSAFTHQIIVQGTDFSTGTTGGFVYAVPAPATAALLLLSAVPLARRRSVRLECGR